MYTCRNTFYYMTSLLSRQDEPNPKVWLATQGGKVERYCLFCSPNKIFPTTKWVQESFLSQNIFRENIKDFL